MPAILPSVPIDSDAVLAKYFMPHQLNWIIAEEHLHARHLRAFILAEKSVRIGWTWGDAFKNVRKRLRYPRRDYLFVTKDLPSALEFVLTCHRFLDFFEFTRAVVSHGQDFLKVQRHDPSGRPTPFTDEIKIGYIKFDNGSRIIAFSSNLYAMAVYGGDVGLDEFAKHPNARLLWETAQGRVTWNGDMAVWSSHDGQDTLFYEFTQQARAAVAAGHANALIIPPGFAPAADPPLKSQIPNPQSPAPNSQNPSASPTENPNSKIENPDERPFKSEILNSQSPAERSVPQIENRNSKIENPNPPNPWNLYYRVTMPDAIELGLLDVINRTSNSRLTPQHFLADCRARAGSEEIYEQAYLCNPMGAAHNHIVEWSAIENCRADYQILRLHLEHDQILRQFGPFTPARAEDREQEIRTFIFNKFRPFFQAARTCRLGFDVAASGQGDLAVVYIDQPNGPELWLRALFSCRTDDWNFLQTAVATFLRELKSVRAAGDQSGLGRQICWELAKHFPAKFTCVNFSSEKHDLGFTLMNQLATAQKRFPRSEQDIAADYFALRKIYQSSRWVFTESPNSLNPSSHCDIAWAGGLASHIHNLNKCTLTSMLG